jgi:hypothetical protein
VLFKKIKKSAHFTVSAFYFYKISFSMTLIEYKASLSAAAPPEACNDLLKALWYAGKNNWHAAHNIAQEIHTREGSWIHAYLHRVEGDIGNATYWYHKAGRPMPEGALENEWEELVKAFL